MGDQTPRPFCCRCGEHFPVSDEPTSWHMGQLRELARAPERIVSRFRDWLGHEDGSYLCGNCYFDLSDDVA